MWIALIYALTASNSASATAVCPMAKSQILDSRAVTGFVEDVNVVGKPDRQTAKDFAADEPGGSTAAKIEKRYAASGDLDCGEHNYGQAQIVLKNDIIVSAAHIFMTGSSCPLPPTPSPNHCKFITKVDNRSTTYEIETVVDMGYHCDQGEERPKYANDWIILKLKKPVSPLIKPYKIAHDPNVVADQKDVVNVAKSPDFNPTNAKSLDKNVRHYGRCQSQYSDPQRNRMETDCDISPGSSGGGVLTPGDDPTLVAIDVASSTRPCADGNGTNKVGEYRHGCWLSLATTVSGDFLSALKLIDTGNAGSKFTPAPSSPHSSEQPYFKDL